MAKRRTYHEKKEQAVIDLINKMFEIAGHQVTYEDIKGRQDQWYLDWTITEEQDKQWKEWGKKYLMKNLKLYSKMAEREMAMVGLMWGLRFEKFKDECGKIAVSLTSDDKQSF